MQILRRLPLFLLAASLSSLAQTPAPAVPPAPLLTQQGTPLSPDLARKIEVLIRQKANIPPASTIQIGPRVASADVPGWSTVSITFTNEGTVSRPITFLLSPDNTTLAQLTKFTIPEDPKKLVSPGDRPARGGPENAPVTIVGFDDLECPYCARLYNQLFPTLLNRYGNQVRIVFKDYPLPADQHPWAMHAAVDANCLLPESPAGYWNLVDYVHGHLSEIGVPKGGTAQDRTPKSASDDVDRLTREQAHLQNLDIAKVDSCIARQDTKTVDASVKLGEELHLDGVPDLFINGDKVDGAVPLEFVFGIIDDALRAEGVTPPPPYVAPAPPAPPAPLVTPAAPDGSAKPATVPPPSK